MQLSILQKKAAAGGLPLWRQFLEMSYLFVRHGFGPGYYLMARFWRPQVRFAQKCKHWNGRRYLRFVHRINDPRYFKVSQNKLVEKSLLSALGIPTTSLVGLFHRTKGHSTDGAPLRDVDDLTRILLHNLGYDLFFKPAEGDSGRGVFCLRLSTTPDGIALHDVISNARITVQELLEKLTSVVDGYVVEHAIVQHPVLSGLNSSSVNTLRMWVIDDRKGVRVIGAFLRVGRSGSLVDNTAAGGLACAIDLETGTISQALDLTLERNEYSVHPDSSAQLVGLQIPHWAECKYLACNALRVLPGARFSGMDIAVTERGPLVVEYNVEPSQQGATHFDIPHKILFADFETG